MRWEVVNKLLASLDAHQHQITTVAIVGGSSKDPEVAAINSVFSECEFDYLGIDNYGNEEVWVAFDLNKKNKVEKKYDLVVCCQVLEHVWNMNEAFTNLSNLITSGGLIWVNCPSSNIAHGSPDYYSAGYTPEYLERNMFQHGVTCVTSGSIGSKRYYFATHMFRLWATSSEHQQPITGYRIPSPITKGKILEFGKRIPGRLFMMFWDKKLTENIDYSTETYFLGKHR
jgi:hypothetical protein